MPDFVTYLTPTSAPARFVVQMLSVLVVVWLSVFAWRVVRVRSLTRTIRKLTDSAADLAASQRSAQPGDDGYRACLEQIGVPAQDPIARHVGVIYAAGLADAALEPIALLSATEAQIARYEQALRYVLGAFVIVGLLGTLFGLAEALSSLNVGGAVQGTRQSIPLVLSGLRNAFAPSIWGIIASILGTLLFAAAHAAFVGPAVAELRISTVAVWMPALVPAVSQRAAEAAQKSLQAAYEVSKFAEEIKEDTGRLSRSVRRLSNQAEILAPALDSLNATLGRASAFVDTSLAGAGGVVSQWEAAATRWVGIQTSAAEALGKVSEVQMGQLAATQSALQEAGRQSVALSAASGALQEGLKTAVSTLGSATSTIDAGVAAVRSAEMGLADRVAQELGNQVRVLREEQNQWGGSVASRMDAALSATSQQAREMAERLEADHLAAAGHFRAVETNLEAQTKRMEAAISTMTGPFNDAANRLIGVGMAMKEVVERVEQAALRFPTRPEGTPVPPGQRPASPSDGLRRVEEQLGAILAELQKGQLREPVPSTPSRPDVPGIPTDSVRRIEERLGAILVELRRGYFQRLFGRR